MRHYAVLSKLWVPTSFIEFFRQPANRKAVWSSEARGDMTYGFNHAVS